MSLRLQTVPAQHGLLWVQRGWKVFLKRPLPMAGLVAGFMMFGLLLEFLPLLGPFLMMASLPLLSLAYMLATHLVLQQQTPTLAVFAAPLQLTRERRRTQLRLGLGYAVAVTLLTLLCQWLDGGAFNNLMQVQMSADPSSPASEAALEAALENPQLAWSVAAWLTSMCLLAIPYWYAPALVHWAGQSALQALFSSTLAVWRNRGAFVLYLLSWFSAMVSLFAVLALLSSVISPSLLVLSIPLGLLLTACFYASRYFTFVDCFLFDVPKASAPAAENQA